MIQTSGANVHILAKEAYNDQRELISMLKATYADYWNTKNDGQPRESVSEGNYYIVEHRVHRMGNGGPLIDKKVYFKQNDGHKIRVQDEVKSPKGTVEFGLEKQKEIIEKIAFLSSAYELHERSEGDIARIDESTGDLDVYNISIDSMLPRELLRSDYPQIYEGRYNFEVVNWQFVSTDIETWKTSKDELLAARSANKELALPPSDGGYPRFEKNYNAGNRYEGNAGNTNPKIVFG